MQVNASGLGNASQQVFVKALPSVPILYLNRVRHDATAGGITKIGKFIQFASELGITLGTIFTFFAAAEAKSTS